MGQLQPDSRRSGVSASVASSRRMVVWPSSRVTYSIGLTVRLSVAKPYTSPASGVSATAHTTILSATRPRVVTLSSSS